jgi:hypothetical protein
MEHFRYLHSGVVFMTVSARGTHLNGLRMCTHTLETTRKGFRGSNIRIELWRARIRTGSYQVNGHSLAACILIKEAHFFRL